MEPTLQASVIRIALWVLAVLAAASAIALVAPGLVARLEEAKTKLANLSERIAAWVKSFIDSRWQAFWQTREAEPLEPVLRSLRNVEAVAADLGKRQVERLAELDRDLADKVRLLKAVVAPHGIEGESDVSRIKRVIADGGYGALVGLGFLAAVFGLANAALLSMFFREFGGTRPILPAVLPWVQTGHFIAALFFVAELASGWMLHRYGAEHQHESGQLRTSAHRFFYGTGWFLIVSLAIVELWAYAVLSDRFDIAAQLKLNPEEPLYGFARFFFALFGPALTGALAGIGHAFAEANQKRRRAAVENQILQALRARDEAVIANVDRVRASVTAIQVAASAIPTNVAGDFHQRLGLSTETPAPVSVHLATVQSVASTKPGSASVLTTQDHTILAGPPTRNRSQIVGDLFVGVIILGVLLVVSFLTVLEAGTWTATSNASLVVLGWAVGLLLAGGCMAVGVAARNSFFGLRYSSLVEQVLANERGRRANGVALTVTAIILCLVLSLLAAAVGTFRGSVALNAVLGFAQGAVLITLGGFLDACGVSLVHTAYLLWLGALRAVAFTVSVLAHALAAIASVAQFVVRMLAVPGEVLLGLFGRGKGGPSVPATS